MKFCSHCGGELQKSESWPKTCPHCKRDHFKNPIPVSVVLLPVDDALVTIRRVVGPGTGKLALPGGFVDWGETWQEAGAREVFEEIGVTIAPEQLKLLQVVSVEEGVVLIFSQAPKHREKECDFKLDENEVSELVLLSQAEELAFSTHTEQVRAYFERRTCPDDALPGSA